MHKVYESKCTNGKQARVYWDREWGEYVVKFYLDGSQLPEADYSTSDQKDAIDTADNW